jgi:hypothetical protein
MRAGGAPEAGHFAPAVCLFFAAWAGAAIGADQVSVEAMRQGTAVAINAQATLKAPHALIWATLTDYDHLTGFIPGMTASRVVERRGGGVIIVEQTGAVGLLFFFPTRSR